MASVSIESISGVKPCNEAGGVLYLFRRGRICRYQSLCMCIDTRHSLSKNRLRSMVCVRTIRISSLTEKIEPHIGME
jgi:hypothetical protein